MSREAEARSGILGDDAREAAMAVPASGMPTWPMTAEQMAWARTTVDADGYRALAWWLRERAEAGKDRFSQKEVPFDALGASPAKLLELGLLRIHSYPSGARQYAANPFTRSWFLFVITTPKDSACPSSPSTPKPADSTLAPTPS